MSCNSENSENQQADSSSKHLKGSIETVNFEKTDNLKLTLADTLKKSNSYFFSNLQSKDLFLLTIEPGLIKNSSAKLQIITTNHKVIYTQSFDALYFVKGIYEPDTVPTTGGQKQYEKYVKTYWKSITSRQYESFFKKSVDNFFSAVYPITKNKYEDLKAWNEDILDKDFLNEVLSDSTIHLIDTCLGCDEGGEIIGFSKRRNKVISLVGHD
jgi:hypothetical protein